MGDRATPLRPSEMKLRIKQANLTTTDHHRAAPSLLEEEKTEIIKRDDARTVAPASPSEEEEAREGINKRIKRVERIVAPCWLSLGEKRRIEEVARRVMQDPEGCLTEKVLLRLLRLTRKRVRWGFLSPDHPVHPYYLQLKDIERCRMLRSEMAAGTDR